MSFEQIVIVRSKTRLEQLVGRYNTKAQAKFYLERSGSDFSYYEMEHEKFYQSLDSLLKSVRKILKYKVLDRSFLPSYIFAETDLIVVIGQDGLVANTAKYVKDQPIIAVNPDEKTYDGILLPFNVNNAGKIINKVINGEFRISRVSMAKAEFSDGQTLLAFNDFFIGVRTHTSARYILTHGKKSEHQSSSGIIICTGAGSTGWMSSVFNMVNGIASQNQKKYDRFQRQMNWQSNSLLFAVREPFLSKTTSVSLCFGEINQDSIFSVESEMPDNGIVFSDGIEADAVHFNSGMKVTISVAEQKAHLVIA